MAGRPRDDRQRQTILRRAADLASRDGLDGLTIGRLATDLGVSKSGLFGYFGSKEELQLATIRTATDVYLAEVVRPALAVPAGVERVRLLCEKWLSYSERRVFPGGCFFFAVTAEFDARPGRVRDALVTASRQWQQLVAGTVAEAGELTGDPDQLAFELISYLETANAMAILHDDPAPYARARAAIDRSLARAAA